MIPTKEQIDAAIEATYRAQTVLTRNAMADDALDLNISLLALRALRLLVDEPDMDVIDARPSGAGAQCIETQKKQKWKAMVNELLRKAGE